MTTLEVNFVKMAECLISSGRRLSFPANEMPSVHYNLIGSGQLIVGDAPPVSLSPHTLIIVPPRQPYRIDVAIDQEAASTLETVEARWLTGNASGSLWRFVAGDSEPQLILICGHFRAFYGASIDLFAALAYPIVERFDAADQLEQKLKSVLAELVAQEVGMIAMTTALLKQILVTLLRRSLSSGNLWVERFSMLSNPQIARAFADMAARPGAPHSLQTLSQSAGLSRSAFMARFAETFGRSPMTVLRQLRMRQAAVRLAANNLSIDQIAHEAGYTSHRSFLRAFRKVYGSDPSDYRAAARRPPDRARQGKPDLHNI
jgi:AraC family transcriptional activator of mtrCDE